MNWKILDTKTMVELLPNCKNRKTMPTDFSILLGAETERKYAGVFLATAHSKWHVQLIDEDGRYDCLSTAPQMRLSLIRPAVVWSEFIKVCPSAESNKIGESFESNLEYPTKIASNEVSDILAKRWNEFKKLEGPTVDSYSINDEDHKEMKFKARKIECVEYKSKYYVKVQAKPFDDETTYLKDGKKVLIDDDKFYYVEYQRVTGKHLIDKSKNEYFLCDKGILCGIQFDLIDDYRKYQYEDGDNIDINNHAIGKYMAEYFTKDIEQSLNFAKYNETNTSNADNNVETLTQYQPQHWGVTVNDKIMSINDQIKFYVEHNKSFMLHGSSGVGKSLRVREIDSDLTFIHIPNGVLPESILGKVIYSNGKSGIPQEFIAKLKTFAQQNNLDIDELLKDVNVSNKDAGEWKAPDWYVEVCAKCQREPDKQHVLFIDEITNAKPTTQSLVYHIILERSIGPNKGKLPDNCVIVAAGNNIDESDASYNMPEPLFRRFDGHIYIKPNVSDWILWGSKKVGRSKEKIQRIITPLNKINDRCEIHPLVSAFIASAPDCMMSEFKPDSQISFAIDQRGWDQVSDIIYDNNGELRYELIRNKVGDEIAKSFIEFAKNPPLTLENICSNNYTKLDIPANEEEKLVLTSLLRYADERQVETVRDFVKHNLGKEMLAIFDSLWCDGDTEREVFIANMNQTI